MSNSQHLNRQLKRKPYTMQKIRKIILKVEDFKYATSLDLNMVYYHITLSEESSNLCMITIHWVNYRYKHLQIGVRNSSDSFQEKMNEIFHRFDFIRAYIDNLLIITKSGWLYQLDKLGHILEKIKDSRLKCNIEKSFFDHIKKEYLAFLATRNSYQPVND